MGDLSYSPDVELHSHHLFYSQKLLAKQREVERKERKAERAERIFLAEETQEKKILQQKLEAALAVSTALCVAFLLNHLSTNTCRHATIIQEEERFEKVEKEYERVAEIAKEDELELG